MDKIVAKLHNPSFKAETYRSSAEIPVATQDRLGIVKGSIQNDKIYVFGDGTMGVNSININKLYQIDKFILDAGDSNEEVEPDE